MQGGSGPRGKAGSSSGSGSGPRAGQAPRRSRGFQRTSALLKDRIKGASQARGFAVTRILTHWAEIVGEQTAAQCRPIDVKYGRNGFGATLSVLTTGAMAPMLQMQEPQIRDKINAVYGYAAISKIRITQTAPTGFAEGQAVFGTAPKRTEKPTPPPAVKVDAARLSDGVENDALRQALQSLAEHVLTRNTNAE
jgi:hypothetical protein